MRSEYVYEEDFFDEMIESQMDLKDELEKLKQDRLYLRESLEDYVDEEILIDLFGE